MRSRLFHASMVVAPVSLFVSIYLATFITTGYFMRPYAQWAALLGVTVATCITILLWEHGKFTIGFFVRPALAVRECAAGLAFALALIVSCAGLVMLFSNVRERWAGGFPASQLLAVFIPAALHEELLFRGYVYQKLRTLTRSGAILLSSSVFALLHWRNVGISPLAMINILIAGVLLALAYERFLRLWFPIGIHFAWNAMSGPVLGFPVSGFVPRASLMRITGGGPSWITGSTFGIEASLCMTAVEILAILVLARGSKFKIPV